MARIDRLQKDTKLVLQLASVIGRVFLYRVLAAIAQEERELDEKLLNLQSEELIRERVRFPELEYIFKHALTHEAAYNGILKRHRLTYHRQVGEALERLFPDRLDEMLGLLAFHWERTVEVEKAVEYLQRAGDQARILYSHEEAIDYYQRALVIQKEQVKHELAARTLMKLGLTHHNAFDFRQAREAYDEGFQLWQRSFEIETDTPLPPAPHSLRLGGEEPRTLDPTMCNDISSGLFVEQLFSGLVEVTPELDVVPDVARSWEVLQGGQKYIFHLRDDVHWSDGTSVNAEDFVYAWQRVLNPETKSPLASQLFDIKGAEAYYLGEMSDPSDLGLKALDKFTLAVDLEGPTGYFLQMMSNNAAYPVPRHVVDAYGDEWARVEQLVTNGPFMLKTWSKYETLVLLRNPNYHGRFPGNLERVEMLTEIDSQSTRFLEMYEADALDILPFEDFTPKLIKTTRQRHAGEYVSLPGLGITYLGFNVSRPPFDDLRVRRAFTMAFDREAWIATWGRHFLPATGGFIPPGMPGHSPGIALPYDLGGARQLIAETGYRKGFPQVKLIMFSNPIIPLLGEYLRERWRQSLGVDITWEAIEFTDLVARLESEPVDMFIIGWGADYPDPDNFLRVGFPWKYTRWRNEGYERLIESGRRVTNQKERMKLYQLADRILVEQAPILPLIYVRDHMLVKPWVSKIRISVFGWSHLKDVVIETH